MTLKYAGFLVIIMISAQCLQAQSWMSGFNYRKKITIDKSKVIAKTIVYSSTNTVDYDLVDFPVLIDLTDNDLIYYPGTCGNKIQDAGGKDISFALSTAPGIPLNFQVEHYEPASGRLICWVKINALSANKTTTTATSIYLYYGSSSPANLHNPYSTPALNTWNADYSKVLHMNALYGAPGSQNLSSDVSNSDTFKIAKIGFGLEFNATSAAFNAGIEESTTISISGWIKPSEIGRDQVILTNDSLARGGYQLRMNTDNKLVLDVFKSPSAATSITENLTALNVGTWYHVCVIFSGTVGTIYLNGIPVVAASNPALHLGSGGTLRIGRNRLGNNKFYGIIDELRIQKITIGTEWMKTEYNNQNDPTRFYTVSAEEYSPSGFYRFTGSSNQWNLTSNWSPASLPGLNANIVIPSGKTVRYSGGSQSTLNKLIIEKGGSLTLAADMQASCISQVASGGAIILSNGATLTFSSNVFNNGSISSDISGGTIRFSGVQQVQDYSGTGILKVQRLKNEQTDPLFKLVLNSAVEVKGFVEAKKGILISNGNLILRSTSATNTAAVMPINDPNNSSINGEVIVQQFISGSYAAPASARGWRLLSSPVYTITSGGITQYDLQALKNEIFITGNGGQLNGFDPSPLNGATVYTHDQSLPGTLSQKYIAVKTINDKIQMGKGIYIYSRGSRYAQDAYLRQIQTNPFSNPESYTIKYKGQLFNGTLNVALSNKNTNSEGDGFNLIGNPYASPIRWGSLGKTGIVPYIWQFDPLNNAYIVSESPETIIPLGGAFFVRVNSGRTDGSISFTEEARYTGPVYSTPVLMSDKSSVTGNILKDNMLTITLSKEDIKQSYILKLKEGGSDDVTDEDALKLGDGIVNVGGISGKVKLAIDERALTDITKQVDLYIKVAVSGTYKLTIDPGKSTAIETFLIDKYMGTQQEVGRSILSNEISINKDIPATEGEARFQLLIKKMEVEPEKELQITAFPNPFREKITFNTNLNSGERSQVVLRNIMGNTVFQQEIRNDGNQMEINTANIPIGLYILQFISANGKNIKAIKVLKN
ncbi:hypothetical protein ACVWYN_002352 [Pedobacter sp. UYP24]